MIARYLDPDTDSVQEVELADVSAVDSLLGLVTELGGQRGTPAVELSHPSGATLVIGQAGALSVLMFTDALGTSSHSVGSASHRAGESLVIDYLGSYTEIPIEYFVEREVGRAGAIEFLTAGTPFAPDLNLEPD